MREARHFVKPGLKKLIKLCADSKFKKRIAELRKKWGIEELLSPDSADNFWRGIVKADHEEPNYPQRWYQGETRDKRLQRDLKELCKQPGVDLSPEAWITLYHVLVCLDLDNVRDDDLMHLPLHPFLVRCDVAPWADNPIKDYHLYLDVTFATFADVREVWSLVTHWQENIRPSIIARGDLPNLLEDVKAGRPRLPDDICLECARLRDEEHWRYKQISEYFGFPIHKDAYGKRTQCRKALEAVRRGRQLKKNFYT